MSDNKLKWEKPKLVILTRGKPEERVLASCKHVGEWERYTYPEHVFNQCRALGGPNPFDVCLNICHDDSVS